MSNSFNELIKQLKRGELPSELNFTNSQPQSDIDWTKVQYNAFYKSPTFFENKFPAGWVDNLPGFDKVLQNIANNAQSPLEEMEERIRKSTIKDDEDKNNI